jgi:two-component system sensor histidine kinase VicK
MAVEEPGSRLLLIVYMSTHEELIKELELYRQQEADLKNRLEDLTDFIENAPMPIHWVDSSGTILWANQAELDLLGYPGEEYIGHSITDFYTDEDAANDVLQRLADNQPLADYFAALKCKDGSVKYVLINSNVYRKDGRFIHSRCLTKDITSIVEEENHKTLLLARLEKSEARLAAIVESSDDAIISKTLEGIITTWNDSAERMFGYKADEIIGKPIQTLIPDDRLDEEVLILKRLREGERVEHFETQRITKDRRIIDLSLTISPVRDTNGKIIGLSKIARDITGKKLEEHRKNDFIAIISHELKTPLTSVRSYVQVLLAMAVKEGHEFSVNALKRAEMQINKMTFMINDFLNLSRLEEGKIHLSLEKFDLYPLLEEIVSEAQFLASGHIIELEGCDEISIYADKNKIGQVIINLLSNAVKYSSNGSRIKLGCEIVEGKVKVYVADEGMGISLSDQKHVFERFFRVESEKLKTISGFGIGLYLVAEILKYHNSHIEVESREGEGSVFYFELDRVD